MFTREMWGCGGVCLGEEERVSVATEGGGRPYRKPKYKE